MGLSNGLYIKKQLFDIKKQYFYNRLFVKKQLFYIKKLLFYFFDTISSVSSSVQYRL